MSALAWLFMKSSKFECSENICVWTNKRKRDFSNHDVTVVTALLKLHAVCGPCSTLMGCGGGCAGRVAVAADGSGLHFILLTLQFHHLCPFTVVWDHNL